MTLCPILFMIFHALFHPVGMLCSMLFMIPHATFHPVGGNVFYAVHDLVVLFSILITI